MTNQNLRKGHGIKELGIMDRRQILTSGVSALGILTFLRAAGGFLVGGPAAAETFAVAKSEAAWRAQLGTSAYAVLRQHGTERAGSSPLDAEKRAGRFVCAACDHPLFASGAKFESGTGWPSFTAPLAEAVGTTTDSSLGMSRTEVHCRRCGGHLGHVFADGPAPTGLRYCMNGVAMRFEPA